MAYPQFIYIGYTFCEAYPVHAPHPPNQGLMTRPSYMVPRTPGGQYENFPLENFFVIFWGSVRAGTVPRTLFCVPPLLGAASARGPSRWPSGLVGGPVPKRHLKNLLDNFSQRWRFAPYGSQAPLAGRGGVAPLPPLPSPQSLITLTFL